MLTTAENMLYKIGIMGNNNSPSMLIRLSQMSDVSLFLDDNGFIASYSKQLIIIHTQGY